MAEKNDDSHRRFFFSRLSAPWETNSRAKRNRAFDRFRSPALRFAEDRGEPRSCLRFRGL